MNRCMETGKPQISILMAVYEPRMDWLREQLLSLDAQTYPNLKLYIRDDCSPTVSYEGIQSCVQDCIRTFPYEIQRNERNLGSNKTFERLTQDADGDYFAYCDQDDVWLPEKLETLERQLAAKADADLICSDVVLIDGNGRKFAQSITEARPRHVFWEGANLAPTLIYHNYVIGCTTLIRSGRAKEAIPFAEHMVHDHYLAFFCALHGAIAVCPEHLVRYRIHGSNQTGVLAHVADHKSYCEKYIMPFCARIEELQRRFSLPELGTAAQWAWARQKNARREPRGMRNLWKLRHVNQSITLFELVVLRLPLPLFRAAVHVIQAGKI